VEPRLVPFDLTFAEPVADWARASGRLAPWTDLPSVETFRDALRDPSVAPFVMLQEDRPVGYGELWTESDPEETELARIIVDPALRRRGIGTALVRGLIAVACSRLDAPIWVRVLPDNVAALSCYAKLGFVRASLEDERRFNDAARSPGTRWLALAATG